MDEREWIHWCNQQTHRSTSVGKLSADVFQITVKRANEGDSEYEVPLAVGFGDLVAQLLKTVNGQTGFKLNGAARLHLSFSALELEQRARLRTLVLFKVLIYVGTLG